MLLFEGEYNVILPTPIQIVMSSLRDLICFGLSVLEIIRP
jgi:hypothetical protein